MTKRNDKQAGQLSEYRGKRNLSRSGEPTGSKRRGAGEVIVWDTGTYDNQSRDRNGHELSVAEAIGHGHVSFVLHGKKLRGGYSLTKMHRGGREAWLLVKKADEFAGGDPVATSPESVKSGRTVDQLGDG
jgi:hypothetical protein